MCLQRGSDRFCSTGESLYCLRRSRIGLISSSTLRLSTLTDELRDMQPAHRGACLEAVAGIAERYVATQTAPSHSR